MPRRQGCHKEMPLREPIFRGRGDDSTVKCTKCSYGRWVWLPAPILGGSQLQGTQGLHHIHTYTEIEIKTNLKKRETPPCLWFTLWHTEPGPQRVSIGASWPVTAQWNLKPDLCGIQEKRLTLQDCSSPLTGIVQKEKVKQSRMYSQTRELQSPHIKDCRSKLQDTVLT